jgi:hypothetical protein
MKRKHCLFAISIAMLLYMPPATMAQVQREDVIVEISTSTWCMYCPGAALGANDLVAARADVGILEYHYDDVLESMTSVARLDY